MQKAIFLLCIVTALSPAQTVTTVVTFNGGNGAGPTGGLIQATDGDFYGTTGGGGSGYGTIYRLTPAGALTTIYTFNKTDGALPDAGLIQAADGNFYGTTTEGGAPGSYGTVFKVTPGGILTTLYSLPMSAGYSPNAPLIQAADGNSMAPRQRAGTEAITVSSKSRRAGQ